MSRLMAPVMTAEEANGILCKALGIDPHGVTSAVLVLEPGGIAVLRLTRMVTSDEVEAVAKAMKDNPLAFRVDHTIQRIYPPVRGDKGS